VNFSLTEEQDQLRDIARRFLTETSGSEAVRAAMGTDDGFDPALWARLGDELGWTALAIPEDRGGFGFSFVDQVVILEELGRHLTCLPYLSSAILGTNALLQAGSDAQQGQWLPGLAAGEHRAALAWVGPTGDWGPGAPGVTATRTTDGWQLDGTARWVLDGHTAHVIVVSAQTHDGVALFCVDATTPGLDRARVQTMDQTRRLANLTFTTAALGEQDRMPGGTSALARTLDLGRVALACEQVGVAEGAMDLAVDYAKVRRQFSRPIGSFQAIKHLCADMLVAVESARSASWYAAWAAAEAPEELALAASMAQAMASEAAFQCAADGLQVHGGIGFTWESDVHLFLKRARATRTMFGDVADHRARVADLVGL
jgi:alkylation response protein AidB-like acyl-CoA dehydrogenase